MKKAVKPSKYHDLSSGKENKLNRIGPEVHRECGGMQKIYLAN
jgi:hypothetical protein